MGAREVWGSERQSEATRDGEAVVLAEHSSEGRSSGREGGEERPNRAINILHTNAISKSPFSIHIIPKQESNCLS